MDFQELYIYFPLRNMQTWGVIRCGDPVTIDRYLPGDKGRSQIRVWESEKAIS